MHNLTLKNDGSSIYAIARLHSVLASLGVSLVAETRRLVYVGTRGDESTYDAAASKKEARPAAAVVRC